MSWNNIIPAEVLLYEAEQRTRASRNGREGRYLGHWMGQAVRSHQWQRLAPGFRFGSVAALSELIERSPGAPPPLPRGYLSRERVAAMNAQMLAMADKARASSAPKPMAKDVEELWETLEVVMSAATKGEPS
jgi:hypothetical protein